MPCPLLPVLNDFLEDHKGFYFDYNYDYNKEESDKSEEDVKHAILVGIISQSQYLAEAAQNDEGEERQQMSDQVCSLVLDQ